MAFIIDSSLHCFRFIARPVLGGQAFSLSGLLSFQAFQADFADRDLFPSWGIAIKGIVSRYKAWLSLNELIISKI